MSQQMTDEQIAEAFRKRLEAHELCIAMHEAGHAILSDALGITVLEASIDRLYDAASKHLGFVRTAQHNSGAAAIAIASAGRAVDETLSDSGSCNANFQSYESDEACIDAVFAAIYPDGSFSREQSASYQTNVHVLRNEWVEQWVANKAAPIRTFASRLQANKKLEGPELKAALDIAWAGLKPNSALLLSEVRENVLNRLQIQDPAEFVLILQDAPCGYGGELG